jgi:hypothetical protein
MAESGKSLLRSTLAASAVLVLVAGLLLPVAGIAYADSDISDLDWTTAKRDNWNSNISSSLAPRNPDEISNIWDFKYGDFYQVTNIRSSFPLAIGDYVYICTPEHLLKLTTDGKLAAKADLNGKFPGNGNTAWLTYGDGKIFVPLGKGSMQAFDAETMKSLWFAPEFSVSDQPCMPILYDDGYVYSGQFQWGGGSVSTGEFYCYSAEDEDPDDELETKSPIWVMDDDGEGGGTPGFYWAGAAIIENYILIPSERGFVFSVNKSASIDAGEPVIEDTLFLYEGVIRGSVVYDEKRSSVLFVQQGDSSTYSGYLFSVGFDSETGKFDKTDTNEDGVFDIDDTLHYYSDNWQRRITPVVYGDRIYANCGGILVIDANSLELIYEARSTDMGLGELSFYHITLCDAYANEENDQTVYLYTFTYTYPGVLAVLEDNQTRTEGELVHMYTSVPSEFSTSNVTIGPNGSLYVVNDSNTLFCIESAVYKNSLDSEGGSGSSSIMYAAIGVTAVALILAALIILKRRM